MQKILYNAKVFVSKIRFLNDVANANTYEYFVAT